MFKDKIIIQSNMKIILKTFSQAQFSRLKSILQIFRTDSDQCFPLIVNLLFR